MAEQPVADERLAVPAVVSVLSAILLRLVERNDAASNGQRAPPSCYVFAYIYLDSFAGSRQDIALDSFNVHHLLITSVLTAIKFMDDMYVSKCHPPQETEQLALGINNCIAQL
ncbi:hypothetical protein ZIOFF_040427 [Zingiber officinale]|uniref:Uncharacterized protein n=1 Tax=Zingiber officinale TaxID=94328 RepID=A0A8J5G8U1_ZINOF|nr:hypothetical protein ZIOFF_040427 [Zingiber officinale]